ncbi:PQQ-binding-like beta-propeller repeat protein [Mycobacterium sp. 21AC1]|uniref:outer membrane protein assembly factor BamB family protein n=1 Tax=[Mycobacterium] appelbergii TaxID=2939269 RepID=UPI002938FA66|nr:PQQ-binding-like beta-propeller repeat protein [Mycobacterium sp. 21AC1]MDV3127410.1 PQQ-binding-like beta-propeller repeat protein [Mycobacterium sp. 21AC1]
MVVAVVFVIVGIGGAIAWWLNRGGDEVVRSSGPSANPAAGPLPASVPPLGDVRPPTDIALPSLEQPIDTPRWTYKVGIDEAVLGGDSYTVVVGSDEGVIALDASSGVPRWSEPIKPPDINVNEIKKGKCVIARAATTMGCALNVNLSTGQPEVLAFFDVATGRTLSQTTLPGGQIRNMSRSGDGIAVVLDRELVAYGSDGTEAWRVDHDGDAVVFGDQAVIVTRRAVYDASTGAPIVSGVNVVGKTAFASGFALSDGNSINFYDFSGRNTASLASDGYRLLDNARGDARSNQDLYGSSGFNYPLAYNDATGDLRAFDGASGRVLWTRPTGQDLTFRVQGYGSDTLCLIGVSLLNDTGFMNMKVQPCQADSANPFVRVSEVNFLGSDGTRLLAVDSRDLVCVDGVTGKELWRKKTTDFPHGVWVGNRAYTTYNSTVTRWI